MPQQLLRSMEVLMDHQDTADECVAQLLHPLIDEHLSVASYDLTTIRAEGLRQQADDVRHFGISKRCMIARQFLLGVGQTADGLPIHRDVFYGNRVKAPSFEPTLKKVLARYLHIHRKVVVADRGLLSLGSIEVLSKLRLFGERALEFILAVPGRFYGEFVDILAPMTAWASASRHKNIEEAQ